MGIISSLKFPDQLFERFLALKALHFMYTRTGCGNQQYIYYEPQHHISLGGDSADSRMNPQLKLLPGYISGGC